MILLYKELVKKYKNDYKIKKLIQYGKNYLLELSVDDTINSILEYIFIRISWEYNKELLNLKKN